MDRVVSETETVIDSAAGDIPRDFQSLRTLIAARRPKLPKRLVQAADFIVKEGQRLEGKTYEEIARDQPAEILRAAGDENRLRCDAVVGHCMAPLRGSVSGHWLATR